MKCIYLYPKIQHHWIAFHATQKLNTFYSSMNFSVMNTYFRIRKCIHSKYEYRQKVFRVENLCLTGPKGGWNCILKIGSISSRAWCSSILNSILSDWIQLIHYWLHYRQPTMWSSNANHGRRSQRGSASGLSHWCKPSTRYHQVSQSQLALIFIDRFFQL